MIRWLLSLLLVLGAATASAQDKRIALTFDDVPRGPGAFLTQDDRTKRLIRALKTGRVAQAGFFVNPVHLAKGDPSGVARLQAYVAAGHVIANHSHTHPNLTEVTAEAYLVDIDAASAWLVGRPGYRPLFRYPMLNEGRRDTAKRDAVRAGLAARGLSNGYATVDGYDWYLEQLTTAAIAAGKPMDRAALRDLYVETQLGAAAYFDALARKALGRSPAHVLLLHETDLAALYLPDLLKALRRNGWRIVSVDEAYADPIAAEAARYDTPSAQGTLTEMLAWTKGLPAPRWYERNDTDLLRRLFKTRVLKEAAE